MLQCEDWTHGEADDTEGAEEESPDKDVEGAEDTDGEAESEAVEEVVAKQAPVAPVEGDISAITRQQRQRFAI